MSFAKQRTYRKENMKPENLVVTPDVFFDLFILSMMFRAKQAGREYEGFDLSTWSTVDSVLRIFDNLKIVTATQRRKISDDVRVQALFVRNARITYGTVSSQAPEDETVRRIIVKVPDGLTGQFLRKQILKNTRIFLSRRGLNGAEVITKYYPWFTELMFLDAYNTSREKFDKYPKKAKGAIIMAYQANVAAELEIERFMLGAKNTKK